MEAAAFSWGFPKIRGPILGIPIRMMNDKQVFWGLYFWFRVRVHLFMQKTERHERIQ